MKLERVLGIAESLDVQRIVLVGASGRPGSAWARRTALPITATHATAMGALGDWQRLGLFSRVVCGQPLLPAAEQR